MQQIQAPGAQLTSQKQHHAAYHIQALRAGCSHCPSILADHCCCFMQADVQVCNDAVAALASGTGGQLHGIVLIAGTGKPLCCFQQDPYNLCHHGSCFAALNALLHIPILGLAPVRACQIA